MSGFGLEIKILSFLHTRAIIARKRIRIETLKDSDDNWITDEFSLSELASNHFKDLYGSLDSGEKLVTSSGFPALPCEAFKNLARTVNLEEVHSAVFSLGAYKASGPDDFQTIFYQQTGPLSLPQWWNS